MSLFLIRDKYNKACVEEGIRKHSQRGCIDLTENAVVVTRPSKTCPALSIIYNMNNTLYWRRVKT